MTPEEQYEDMFPDISPPRTEEQLVQLEATRSKDYKRRFKRTPNFTCSDCGAKATCCFAFDFYNTDGDCLAEK